VLVLSLVEEEGEIIAETPNGKIRFRILRVERRRDTGKMQVRIGIDAARSIPLYRDCHEGSWKGTKSEPRYNQDRQSRRDKKPR
jgi:sRNA-binding carbon storage regulator CsrA